MDMKQQDLDKMTPLEKLKALNYDLEAYDPNESYDDVGTEQRITVEDIEKELLGVD